MQMTYRPQLKKQLNLVSLDTNLVYVFTVYLARQKATIGPEKTQTKKGVIFAKGLDAGCQDLLLVPTGVWTSVILC